MHRITQTTAASQGKKHSKTVPAGTNSSRHEQHEENWLTEFHESAYAQITQTHQVIVIPRYFVSQWLGLLGPSPAWLVLAFRQAAFVARCTDREAIRPISVRDLTRWSGLSHGQIWNLLSQENTYLDWFVRKIAAAPSARQSAVWGVQTAIPIAPHHLHALEKYLNTHAPSNISTTTYLRELLSNLPAILWGAAVTPETSCKPPVSLHQLFERYLGALDKPAVALCDELTARIVQPGNTIAITHYFMDRWRSALKSGESWLVHLLRTQIYASGEGHASLYVQGGKSQLAAALGVTPRSVRRWFADLSEDSPLAQFILPTETDLGEHLSLELTMRDPIHPADEEKYQELLEKDGQNWTHERTKLDSKQENNGQEEGQNWTRGRTYLDKIPDKLGQVDGQNQTLAQTKLNTLTTQESNIQSRTINKQLQQAERPAKTKNHLRGVGDRVAERQICDQWSLDRITQMAGYKGTKRKEILRDCDADPEKMQNLIAWLLYGYAHRQRSGTDDGHGNGTRSGITSPVLFALSRYAHSRPEAVYLSLVNRSPQALATLLQDGFSPEMPVEWRRIFTALEGTGIQELVDLWAGSAAKNVSKLIGVGRQTPEFAVQKARGILDAVGEKETSSSQSEAELPVPKTAVFPQSAEVLWDEIATLTGMKPAAEIISMWLDQQELVLSLLNITQAQEIADGLAGQMGMVQERYPDCTIRIQVLQVVAINQNGLPRFDVHDEIRIPWNPD